MIKKGDKLKMVTCIEADTYKDRIWIARTDEFNSDAGYAVVFLEGFSGYFACEFLEKVEKTMMDYQDVLVKECKYCPFNYENETCTVGAGQNLIGERRDKKNFPKFCLLKHKPVLIRR